MARDLSCLVERAGVRERKTCFWLDGSQGERVCVEGRERERNDFEPQTPSSSFPRVARQWHAFLSIVASFRSSAHTCPPSSRPTLSLFGTALLSSYTGQPTRFLRLTSRRRPGSGVRLRFPIGPIIKRQVCLLVTVPMPTCFCRRTKGGCGESGGRKLG